MCDYGDLIAMWSIVVKILLVTQKHIYEICY